MNSDSDKESFSADKQKAHTEYFKNLARDEALDAAEKGVQAAREALEAAERKLSEVRRNAAYERAAEAPVRDDTIEADFVDEGSEARDRAKTEQKARAAQATQAGQAGGQTDAAWQGYGQVRQSGHVYSQPYYSAAYRESKDHVIAGLLAIFLGCLGIHKFYLGYSKQGFIMLAASIIAGLCTFGLASSVVWIVAIIEGIIYLAKSQSEFERTYVYGRREWF